VPLSHGSLPSRSLRCGKLRGSRKLLASPLQRSVATAATECSRDLPTAQRRVEVSCGARGRPIQHGRRCLLSPCGYGGFAVSHIRYCQVMSLSSIRKVVRRASYSTPGAASNMPNTHRNYKANIGTRSASCRLPVPREHELHACGTISGRRSGYAAGGIKLAMATICS